MGVQTPGEVVNAGADAVAAAAAVTRAVKECEWQIIGLFEGTLAAEGDSSALSTTVSFLLDTEHGTLKSTVGLFSLCPETHR